MYSACAEELAVSNIDNHRLKVFKDRQQERAAMFSFGTLSLSQMGVFVTVGFWRFLSEVPTLI